WEGTDCASAGVAARSAASPKIVILIEDGFDLLSGFPSRRSRGESFMNRQRIHNILSDASSKRILVIGDVMLDEFVWGRVSRISPEAPVPVVEVSHQTCYPGGAANVARNLVEFTPGVRVMGLVGRDAHGGQLAELLRGERIQTDC